MSLYEKVKAYVDEHLELRSEYKLMDLKASFDEDVGKECSVDDCFMVTADRSNFRRSLADLIKERESSFAEAVFKYIEIKGITIPEVYKRANLDRKLFSKIRASKNYQPSKNTALALAIALELNLDETKDFIGKAGYALTHSNEFDIIIEYCIINGIYNIMKINETLFAFGQQMLGSHVV